MPIRTLDVRRDKFLENALLAVTNSDYIADKLFTPRTVTKDSGIIGGIGNEHLRDYRTERALYDRSPHEVELSYTEEATYKIGYHDLSNYVPDRIVEQAENPFNPRRDAGLQLLESLKLKREVELANIITDTSVVTQNTTLSGTSQFNDLGNSNPDTVIQSALDTVQAAIGREANTIMLGRKVMMTLKRHPFFLSLNSGLSVLSDEVIIRNLKDFFGFTNVFVGRTIKVTSAQGQAETKGAVWNNDILVYYKGSGNFDPTFGYNLNLSGYDLRATVRRDLEDEGDIVKVSNAYQDLPVLTEAGFLIKNAVA